MEGVDICIKWVWYSILLKQFDKPIPSFISSPNSQLRVSLPNHFSNFSYRSLTPESAEPYSQEFLVPKIGKFALKYKILLSKIFIWVIKSKQILIVYLESLQEIKLDEKFMNELSAVDNEPNNVKCCNCEIPDLTEFLRHFGF